MTAWLAVPVSLALLVGVLHAIPRVARRRGLHAEVQRKAAHVALGCYALTFPYLFAGPWPVVVVCGATIALFVALRVAPTLAGGLGAALHGVGRASYGDILFAVAVAVLFVLKGDDNVGYVLPVAVLTFADAAASLVGTYYGRKRFTVGAGTKSYEGVALFFLVAWLIATVVLLHLSDVARGHVVLIALLVAFFGSTIEAESWRGWDNLLVPVGLAFILRRYMDAATLEIAVGVALYAALLGVMLVVGPRLGVDRHAARFATVTLFVFWVTTVPINLVAPLIVFASHLVAERRAPSAAPFPHLDTMLVIIAVALLWYVVGEVSGYSMRFAYHLSFGCMAAALLGIAWSERRAALAVGVLLLGAVATSWAWDAGTRQGHSLVPLALTPLAMVLAALLAARLRGALDRSRHLRLAVASVAGAALLAPLGWS